MLIALCKVITLFTIAIIIFIGICFIMSQSAKEQRDRYGDGICPKCKIGYYHLVGAYQSKYDHQTYYIYECDNCRHAETFTVICK